MSKDFGIMVSDVCEVCMTLTFESKVELRSL